MTTRIPRLWHPGNPQTRVFLPDFWLKLVETPTVGRHRLPKNVVKFEIDLRMHRFDVREYLEKIYKLPVRDVRTYVQQGEITYDFPKDLRFRRALWKDEDKKYAFVYLKKGIEVEFPNLFPTSVADELEKSQMQIEGDPQRKNANFVNRDRNKAGEMFGV